MRTRCCAVTLTWCATCKKCSSSAACAGIGAASRVISHSRRIGEARRRGACTPPCRRQRRARSFEKRDLVVANRNELDLEDQRRVGWNDAARAMAAVGHLRRDHQRAPPPDAHPRHALVPAADDAAAAQRKTERRTAIERGVEFAPFFIC